MTKKKRQETGKSQISLIASRLAEILPKYGTPPLKHAQAIEIAALCSGFRTSNAAIAAAKEIGALPMLTATESVITGSGPMHVVLDPGSGRAFGVDDAFASCPPAGCVATPYGTLADASALRAANGTKTSAQAIPPIHVCYFEHRHGHEHFADLSEKGLYDQLETWCREWNDAAFEDILAEAEDRDDAVNCFLDSRTEGWHSDVIKGLAGQQAEKTGERPNVRQVGVLTATVSHRHGENVFVGPTEDDLEDQIAAYCIQSEGDLPEGKGFPRPVESMTSEDIVSHYFANIHDEFLHRHGVTGTVEAPTVDHRKHLTDLLAVFEAKLGKLSHQESFDANDFEECEQAIHDARMAMMGGIGPAAVSERTEPAGKTAIHVAVIHDGDGPNEAFTAATRAALDARLAAWCLSRWEEAADKDVSVEDALGMSDEDIVAAYFDGHDKTDITISVDEDGVAHAPAKPEVKSQAKPAKKPAGAWIAMISYDGGSTGFAAATEDEVKERAAEWCLTNWSDAGDEDMTLEEAMEASADAVLNAYFDDHDTDTMEIQQDEDADLELGRVPRVLIAIRSGAAQVEAVDGKVDVAIVDFDTNEALDDMAIEAKLALTRHSGDASAFDGQIDGHRAFLEEHYGASEI